MGLLDKVKNLFTDEEIIEEEENDTVNIREVKKEEPKIKEENENKLPTFMREKIEKEEYVNKTLSPHPDFALNEEKNPNITISSPKISKVEISNNVNPQPIDNNKFKFPIEFEDSDFIETRSRSSRNNVTKREDKEVRVIKEKIIKDPPKNKEPKVAELYKDKKTEKKVTKKFKATPIISPVYGVLDKNYQAEDVAQNTIDNFERQRPSKNVDFDSVRKKAYGSLVDDIKENLMCENCEYLKEAKECRYKYPNKDELPTEDNLMYDILNDENETVSEDITLETATENYYDYGVEYEPINTSNNYLQEQEEYQKEISQEVKIINNMDEYKPRNKIKEVPPVKSKINLLSTLKKSAGDSTENSEEVNINNNFEDNKNNSNLELTDDLFSIIDSMYEERND